MKNRIMAYLKPGPPAGDDQADEPSAYVRVKVLHKDGVTMSGAGGILHIGTGSVILIHRSAVESAAPGIYQVLDERVST